MTLHRDARRRVDAALSAGVGVWEHTIRQAAAEAERRPGLVGFDGLPRDVRKIIELAEARLIPES